MMKTIEASIFDLQESAIASWKRITKRSSKSRAGCFRDPCSDEEELALKFFGLAILYGQPR